MTHPLRSPNHLGVLGALFSVGLCVQTLCPTTAIGANLLLNSSFRLASNGATPDYWDLHHAAALVFPNLHEQYNLVDTTPPIAGARVVRIVNSEPAFPYVYFLSMVRESKLPVGDYVFSVYLKADRANGSVNLAPSLDRLADAANIKVPTSWQRYSVQFHIRDPAKESLSPMLQLPTEGSYWIAAPQLELGATATPYEPAPEDVDIAVMTPEQRRKALAAVEALQGATTSDLHPGISALFEYSSYRGGSAARLRVSNGDDVGWRGILECHRVAAPADSAAIYRSTLAVGARQARIVEIPTRDVAAGEVRCITAGGAKSAEATLLILAPGAIDVRANQFRRTLQIDGTGFHLRGIMVGSYVPPEWYFSDVTKQGINTLFFYPGDDSTGTLNYADLDRVIQLSQTHGLKLVIGPPVMGQKTGRWRALLDRYADLIKRYRNSTAIIGWFVVDEPQAWTLQKDELKSIYHEIKSLDPHRLAFVNWGSDDVPQKVGTQPHGSLAATDLYSFDYYPFSNRNTNLETYALRSVRAFSTGAAVGTPGHSWIQLYGYLDVIREPTAEELNFMAYVNLLFGANYSFWQIKSNAASTWNGLAKTNQQVAALEKLLMLNSDASELVRPKLEGNFLYSAWTTSGHDYLIVVHVHGEREPFAINLAPIFGTRVTRVKTLFGIGTASVSNSGLEDSLDPYAARVYQLD